VIPRPVADRLAGEEPPDAEALDAGPPLDAAHGFDVGAQPAAEAAAPAS
jgi:hypothetical protein